MTIGERIKELRNALGLTQPQFGERMNATQNTIGRYEVNIVTPSSAAISLICRVFNVNENWLRTGEGEMFIEKDETLLAKLSAEYHLGADDVALITAYLQLSPKDRANIVRSAAIITKAMADGQSDS